MRILRRSCACVWVLCLAAAAAGGEGPATKPVATTAPAGAVPKDLGDDPTIWPNRRCYRRSEPWLVANHDKLRKIRPRVLVLNFANDVDMDGIRQRTEAYIRARAESSRYHGFADANAPAFVEYQVARYVDLRDQPVPAELAALNSSRFPMRAQAGQFGPCDYHALYEERFAEWYGFADPSRPGRFLNLHQLIDAGIIHELWMYCIHNDRTGWPALEVAEHKQYYDDQGQAIPGKHGPAGNGDGPDTLPWSGRTFTVYFFNPHRGIGCAMENFGHLLEAYANHNAVASLTPYVREFAGLDLDKRYGLPFASLYALPYEKADPVTYGDDHSVKLTFRGREYTIRDYVAVGGNVHWPPGARRHYDLSSPLTVRSTMANYRLRNGPDGRDRAMDFHIRLAGKYGKTAPDCQGQWVVYWCQCMPGLGNKCLDDAGKPMRNWWVYLCY